MFCQNSNNIYSSELCEQSQLFVLYTLCFGDPHENALANIIELFNIRPLSK